PAVSSRSFPEIKEAMLRSIPANHVTFFSNLKLFYELGDYFFVHAGIRPGHRIDEQEPQDLLWIRDEFTHSRQTHEKVIVHGHSISREPELRDNRINIDTGAYATNVLTCLVLEGNDQRLLST
ncbi:MAG: serine/threonine protein phosphatase, partial [Kiloniellales bacterium]|nr:serine/threonine protein phosphatase [Kiloniellales bacterium]